MSDPIADIYLSKSRDSLTGAVSECAQGRFDNCANRAYYACFQAAVAALVRARIAPPNQAAQWGHEFVQARFIGDLINRRKHYPPTLRETLIQGLRLRQTADYQTERVKPVQAMRALDRAREFRGGRHRRGRWRAMIAERATAADERLGAAVAELQGLIRERYPNATFVVAPGDDPEGLYLTATVDVEDTDEVFDVVVGRLLDMQVDEGMPVYVLPVRPPERVIAELRGELGESAPTALEPGNG